VAYAHELADQLDHPVTDSPADQNRIRTRVERMVALGGPTVMVEGVTALGTGDPTVIADFYRNGYAVAHRADFDMREWIRVAVEARNNALDEMGSAARTAAAAASAPVSATNSGRPTSSGRAAGLRRRTPGAHAGWTESTTGVAEVNVCRTHWTGNRVFLIPQMLHGTRGWIEQVSNALPATALHRLIINQPWEGAPSVFESWVSILIYPAVTLGIARILIVRRDS
jgi:hypothetical protein